MERRIDVVGQGWLAGQLKAGAEAMGATAFIEDRGERKALQRETCARFWMLITEFRTVEDACEALPRRSGE